MAKTTKGVKTRWAYHIERLIRERVSDTVTTPEQLAAKAGMRHVQALSNLKSRRNPTLDSLQKIADAFGVDVCVLVSPPEAPYASSSAPAAVRKTDFDGINEEVRTALIAILRDVIANLHARDVAAGHHTVSQSDPSASDPPAGIVKVSG